jgi:hypothetical protein
MACFGPFYQGAGCQVAGFPVLLQVVWGGVIAEVGDAAVSSGKWISRKVWGVSVRKSVMGSLKSRTGWELINYYRIVRGKGKKGFIDV